MTSNPLSQPCLHLATPEELQRDPRYTSCNAQPGKRCVWANRYDGLPNPTFHSERLESACDRTPSAGTASSDDFTSAVLTSGLI